MFPKKMKLPLSVNVMNEINKILLISILKNVNCKLPLEWTDLFILK